MKYRRDLNYCALQRCLLDELLRDAKRVIRGTNTLLKLRDGLPDQAAAEQQVAAVYKRLLQSLKKLDKAFGMS